MVQIIAQDCNTVGYVTIHEFMLCYAVICCGKSNSITLYSVYVIRAYYIASKYIRCLMPLYTISNWNMYS